MSEPKMVERITPRQPIPMLDVLGVLYFLVVALRNGHHRVHDLRKWRRLDAVLEESCVDLVSDCSPRLVQRLHGLP